MRSTSRTTPSSGETSPIKILPPQLSSDPDRLERFRREASIVADLNHPNIVTIYSVEEADGLNFFTMEHVDGQVLSDLVPGRRASHGRLSEPSRSLSSTP